MDIKTLIMLSFLHFQILAAQVVTLTECRNMGVENSEELKIARSQLKAAQAETKSYNTNWFPKLSLDAGVMTRNEATEVSIDEQHLPTFVVDPATGELLPNVVVNPETGTPVMGADGNPVFNEYAYIPSFKTEILPAVVYGTSLSLEQPIYTGGKISQACKMSKVGEQMLEVNVNRILEEKILAVDEAYWTVVGLQQKQILVRQNSILYDSLYLTVERAVSAGMATEKDLLTLKVKKSRALAVESKVANGLKLAQMALKRLIGVNSNEDLVLVDSINTIPEKPRSMNSQELIHSLDPYVIIKKKSVLGRHKVKLSRANYAPEIGLKASYSYLGYELNDKNHSDFSGSASLLMNWPIWHWGERRHKLTKAKEELYQAQQELIQTEELLQLAIAQAENRYIDAIDLAHIFDDAMKEAEESLRIQQESYSAGMATLTDLLIAQTEWEQVVSEKIDSYTECKIAESHYLKSIGRL